MTRANLAEKEQIGRLRMERLGVLPKPQMPLPQSEPLEPSKARKNQGGVSRSKIQVADSEGGIGRPYMTRDVVAAMERRGAISSPMRIAADEFRAQFKRAHLNTLKAADYGRVPGGGLMSEEFARIETARNEVWRKIVAVGGLSSPAGSCLWHVIGLEQALKSWALEYGNARSYQLRPDGAAGVLIAALGALAK